MAGEEKNGRSAKTYERKFRHDGFTDEKRERFLNALASSGNVRKAAAAAGIDNSNAYRARDREPDFAERWDGALNAGYSRLEQLLLEKAGAGGEDVSAFDPALALELLRLRDARGKSRTSGGGARPQRIPVPELKEILLQKLEILNKRLSKRNG